MTMDQIKKQFDFAIQKASVMEDGVEIEGYASTDTIDRVGDVIPSSAWDTKNYEKNPILLFNHNYNEPIGKATSLDVTDKGLYIKGTIELDTKVSKMVQKGVLRTFSVGFILKDAKYDPSNEVFYLTDVELLEISVVSVPANPEAVFDLAKNEDERNMLVKMYGQTEAKVGQQPNVGDNDMAGEDTKAGAPEAQDSQDINAVIAKAVNDAVKKAQEATNKVVESAIEKVTVKHGETGTEKLMEEAEKKIASLGTDVDEEIRKLRKDLEEKSDEIEQMKNHKRDGFFPSSDRGKSKEDLMKENAEELLQAHLFAKIMGKRRIQDTTFGASVVEKLGVDATADAALMDDTIRTQLQKGIEMMYRVGSLFRKVPVDSDTTTMPMQPDVNPATWQETSAPTGILDNRGSTGSGDNQYRVQQIQMRVNRAISSTYIDNSHQEKVILNLMPMLVDRVARAHAVAVEHALLNGNGAQIAGLTGVAAPFNLDVSDDEAFAAGNLLDMRVQMGHFGLNPMDVYYIVSIGVYYALLQSDLFADVDQVAGMATKVQGAIGSIYGSQVIVTDQIPGGDLITAAGTAQPTPGNNLAFAVNPMNYVMPILRNVTIESEYEVNNQRRVIVAYQHLGFTELQPRGTTITAPGPGRNAPGTSAGAAKITWVA